MLNISVSKNNISNILIKFIKSGVFFILFIPLIMYHRAFFPFIVPKNVLFRIAVELIFAAYLILIHLRPEFKPKFNKLTWLVISFFGVSTIAGIFGIGWYRSFWSNYERMSGLFHFYHLLAYFFVLINVFKNKKDWHSFLSFSIFSGTLMTLLGFAQWMQIPFLLKSSGGSRLSGTVGNATFFAAYLIFNLFFILYFWAREKRFNIKLFSLSFLIFDSYIVLTSILFKISSQGDWGLFEFLRVPILSESFNYPKLLLPFLLLQIIIFVTWYFREKKYAIRVLLSILFLLEFFIFFNTQTRGAVIGFFVSIFFLALVSLFLKIDKRIKISGLVFIVLVVSSPFVLVGFKESSFIKNVPTLKRLSEISLTDITTESRFLTWEASWKGLTQNPKTFLIGYGPENYYYVFNKYFPAQIYKDQGSRVWFDRAHNIIFDVSVTTGMIGLLIYLAIFILASWRLFENYKKDKAFSSSFLLIALLVAYFIQNIFVFDTINTEIPFFLLLAFISFIIFTNSKKEEEETNKDYIEFKEPNILYVGGVVVVLLILIFGFNVKTIKANSYLYQGLISKEVYKVYNKEAIEKFKDSINIANVGKYEARQQLAQYINGYINQPISDIDKNWAKDLINLAVLELRNNVEEEPKNIRHYLYLSTFYNSATKFNSSYPQKVINLLDNAIELSPTRPHIYYEIAQAYTFLGDFDKAGEYFKRGLALAPWVVSDHWNVAGIYIVSGQNDLAKEELRIMEEDLNWLATPNDYQKIVNLYVRVENFEDAIKYKEKIIKLDPNNYEHYPQLAALYAKIGENQKAVEVTQKAVELNPEFKQEAELFIDLLNQGKLSE